MKFKQASHFFFFILKLKKKQQTVQRYRSQSIFSVTHTKIWIFSLSWKIRISSNTWPLSTYWLTVNRSRLAGGSKLPKSPCPSLLLSHSDYFIMYHLSGLCKDLNLPSRFSHIKKCMLLALISIHFQHWLEENSWQIGTDENPRTGKATCNIF